jgi:hypothetical protein
VDLIGAEVDWIDKLCGIHLQDKTLITNQVTKKIVESSMETLNDFLNKSSKQDIIKVYESLMAEESLNSALQNSLNLYRTFFSLDGPKNEAYETTLLRQIEFEPSAKSSKLLDEAGQVNRGLLLKKVLVENVLFLRMMNPGFFFTTIEHQLAREKLVFRKHQWSYPYMADFALPEGLPQLAKPGQKPVPVAIFVADADSFVVGTPQLPRYLVSQSKLHFKALGYIVVTVLPEHIKLKVNPDVLTELIISTSKTTISITN